MLDLVFRAYAALHLLSLPQSLEDIDSINFALGVNDGEETTLENCTDEDLSSALRVGLEAPLLLTAAIFVGEPRHYGAVPAIGDHVELPKTLRAKSLKS